MDLTLPRGSPSNAGYFYPSRCLDPLRMSLNVWLNVGKYRPFFYNPYLSTSLELLSLMGLITRRIVPARLSGNEGGETRTIFSIQIFSEFLAIVILSVNSSYVVFVHYLHVIFFLFFPHLKCQMWISKYPNRSASLVGEIIVTTGQKFPFINYISH
jgi:hypothetical protein